MIRLIFKKTCVRAALLCGVVAFLAAGSLAAPARAETAPKDVDAEHLTQMIKGKNPPYIIDVREPVEYEEFHIDGAVNIPLGQIEAAASTLPKDRTILVYCRSGRRSKMAQKMIEDAGIQSVTNLLDGVFTWAALNKCDAKKKAC